MRLAKPASADPPVSMEPVLGWRVWRLDQSDAEAIRLVSMTRQDLWPPGEPFAASCSLSAHDDGIPGRSCCCGIYAASTPEGLARAGVLTGSVAVVGVIAMWGTVIEHDRGARAQLAYPARLRLICGACLQQGRGAVDPSVVIGSGTSQALCVRHAIGRRGPRTPAARVQADLLSNYAIDLLPLERASSALRIPHVRRDPLDVATKIVESAVPALGSLLRAALFLWTIAGFLFMAFWIAALVAEPFLGD